MHPADPVDQGSILPSERIIDCSGRIACMLTRKHQAHGPGRTRCIARPCEQLAFERAQHRKRPARPRLRQQILRKPVFKIDGDRSARPQEIERDRKRLLGMGDVEIGHAREGGAPQGGVRISQLPAIFCARVAVQHMRHLASRSGEQTDSFAHREIQHRYKGKGSGLDDLPIAVLQSAIEPRAQHGDVIAGAGEGACFLDHARIVAKVIAGQNDHSADHRRPGGAEGGRTPDLLIANEALSQLSYGPAKKQP